MPEMAKPVFRFFYEKKSLSKVAYYCFNRSEKDSRANS